MAHSLSAYLLLYQHYRGLREVWYCHKLFWGISLVCSILVIRLDTEDVIGLVIGITVAILQSSLFLASFFGKGARSWRDLNDSVFHASLLSKPRESFNEAFSLSSGLPRAS